MSAHKRPLGSTYRLQLNGFGIRKAAGLVGYLHDLGIETLYLSPIARAAKGSSHGYDVVDPTALDPALGTAEDFETLLQVADVHEMRILLDIVPNHMSTSPENLWFADVLRRGQGSEFARCFDIDWDAGGGRVLLPVLEKPIGEVLSSGEIEVRADWSGELSVWYRDRSFPLSPGSTAPGGPDAMLQLLDAQHYRLAHWRVAPWEINYRRFFDIDDLVAVRVEDPEVYRRTHAFTLDLAADRRVAGVRVDHVDGLADPAAYLRRLHEDLPGDSALLIEKVLARDEDPPESWLSDGTTGYEFADVAFAVLTDPDGAARISGRAYDVDAQAFIARAEALQRLFPGSLDRLAREVALFAGTALSGRDIPVHVFRDALEVLTAHLSVYRTYSTPDQSNLPDIERVDSAVAEARRWVRDELTLRGLEVIRDLMLGIAMDESEDPSERQTRICVRWQQLCSAVAAKGVEDTALYRFPGLLSSADVGSDPGEPAIGLGRFHQAMLRRSISGRASLNATSTHDSKRSEDSRCRLAVLSEIPDKWEDLVRDLRDSAGGGLPPDVETFLYQSIVAIWPLQGGWDEAHTERVIAYGIKAAREAKVHTSWSEPEPEFEHLQTEFVRRLLAAPDSLSAIGNFIEKIAAAAALNSLALVVMKTAAPGVPDFYQGTETWRHLLVDPDNRREVDFAGLRGIVSGLPRSAGEAATTELLERWRDGSIKTFVIREALRARRCAPRLFAEGSYVGLEVRGANRSRVLAFARVLDGDFAVAVIPRLTARMEKNGDFPIGKNWGDTEVVLPGNRGGRLTELFSARVFETGQTISLADLFATLPIALLLGA